MTIALALDKLCPAAEYSGSLTADDKSAFDALDWQDARAKPSWSDVETVVAASEETSKITRISFLDLMALFSADEQEQIVGSAKASVRLFCLMAAGASFINLTDERTIAGVEMLETLSLVGKGRAAEILSGKKVSNP